MTQLINVILDNKSEEKSLYYCRELEKGNILFFQKSPFFLPDEELSFLLSKKSASPVVFNPENKRLAPSKHVDEESRMQKALESFSSKAAQFLSQLLPSYSARWKIDETILQRKETLDSNHLSIDTAKSRPTQGSRVLRFFANFHPTEGKRWATSKSFTELAQEFAGKALPFPKALTNSFTKRLEKKMKGLVSSSGIKLTIRSPYDQFMLRLQRFLKQKTLSNIKMDWDFPAGSCWAFFTDQVTHTALSGMNLLEQAFLIPNGAMLYPDRSPISILERLSNQNLVDPARSQP